MMTHISNMELFIQQDISNKAMLFAFCRPDQFCNGYYCYCCFGFFVMEESNNPINLYYSEQMQVLSGVIFRLSCHFTLV